MFRSRCWLVVCIVALSVVVGACMSSGDGNEDTPPPASPASPTTVVVAVPSSSQSDDESSTPFGESTSTPSVVVDGTAASPASTSTATVAAPEGTTTVDVAGHTLTVPAGYSINVYAADLGFARFMALDPSGVLFLTDSSGRVLKLPDANGDGVADSVETVLDGLNRPHGITFHDGELYVAEETRVIRATDADADGTYETISTIIDGLPQGGHWSRTIRFGADDMLYLSVGSSCNVCNEDDPIRAAIWRYNADGSGGEPFATGLRNAVGIAFHELTEELWATNNGRDGMGDDVPPETINQPSLGDDFGWPKCHAGDIVDPDYGDAAACDGVTAPAVLMQAHSAPLGLAFAVGEQLSPFDGDLLVAFHGSWNRSEPTGYKVVRIPFDGGVPVGPAEDFVVGWLLPDGDRWGRPVDVIVVPDGSLLISDDETGTIYRLSRIS